MQTHEIAQKHFPRILFNDEIAEIANDGCLDVIDKGALVELVSGELTVCKYSKEVYAEDIVYKRA